MLRPWAEAGYRCIAVDLQHPPGSRREGGIEYVHGDVCTYLPPNAEYAACFAFPPCTHLASSGARWFAGKGLRALIEALEVVEACRRICEWTCAPWCLENPVGTLSTYWRKPDYRFDPCDYGGYLIPPGDHYTKRTCLWVGNGFRMPAQRPVQPYLGSLMHMLPESKQRADLRSVTPMGFAQAVFNANSFKGLTLVA